MSYDLHLICFISNHLKIAIVGHSQTHLVVACEGCLTFSKIQGKFWLFTKYSNNNGYMWHPDDKNFK